MYIEINENQSRQYKYKLNVVIKHTFILMDQHQLWGERNLFRGQGWRCRSAGEMTKDRVFIASGFTEQSAEGQKGDEYIGYRFE